MLSDTSLIGVLVSVIVGTAIVVIILVWLWTKLHRRNNNNNRSAKWNGTIERAHDAELGITPYDLETEMLGDLGEDFDRRLKIDLFSLFTRIDHYTNVHFRRGARVLVDELEIEELLRQTITAEGQGQDDANIQLNAQRLMSLLRDPKERKDAAHHLVVSSICAALDIEGDNRQRSLVPTDYMSFVKSLRGTGDSQFLDCLFSRVRLLKRVSIKDWETEHDDIIKHDEQCRRMIDHLCQILGPYSSVEGEDEDKLLRSSMREICNKAHVLGHNLTRLGPRYKFNCPSSIVSMSLIPNVKKATDSWGQQYQKGRLVIKGVTVNKRHFFKPMS